ncbi:hypothetical protein I7I51_08840 [Histoplasma capsulatum]|uniref:Tse2 ADP-ribosyltransferase toxin domain-containing protein n=1 Tax=Ajellomyces capsulatus TaxID=5037 RepID=A0A8A1M1F4_AJECA|nr:hypothetical protein I7I51_08840 [Histoplasma capsulatum]
MSRYIQSFTSIPKELFRLNNGAAIRLRARPGPLRPQGSFDLLTEAGKVKPKALAPASYEASLRPNTSKQHDLVKTFRGASVCIYSVPADDLILIHEFGDHYSLQAKKEMSVEAKSLTVLQS